MKTAILARHAESELSIVGRTNGDPTLVCGLTEPGGAEARQLALEGRDIPRLVLPELNDIRFGDFEGLALADYHGWARAHGPEEPAPGGESRAETVRRYVRGYRTILARSERTILVVVHGLPVRHVLDALAGRTPAPAVGQAS